MADEIENPHAWLTPQVFGEFLEERNVTLKCELCASETSWAVETGSNDGLIPRSPIYPMTANGLVNTSAGKYLAVIRVRCMNCGNIRYHDAYAVELWRNQRGKNA